MTARNGAVCPRCGSDDIASWQKTPVRFMCKGCFKTFQPQRPKQPERGGGMPVYTDEAVITSTPIQIDWVASDQTLVGLFDAHLEPHIQNHPSFEIATQFVEDTKPEIIIVGGDWVVLGSLSAWDRHRRLLIENKRYEKDITQGRLELERLRANCPDSRIIFFEGNHEYRTVRYVEQYPEMEGQLNVKWDLRLDDLGIEWVPFNEIIRIGKVNYLHGTKWNKYFARSTLEIIGQSCVFGHAHRYQVWTQRLRYDQDPHIALGCPCLCDESEGWRRGALTDHMQGFCHVEYRADGTYQPTVLTVVKGKMSWGGRTWEVL